MPLPKFNIQGPLPKIDRILACDIDAKLAGDRQDYRTAFSECDAFINRTSSPEYQGKIPQLRALHFLYVIEAVSFGFYKIGITSDTDRRLRELQDNTCTFAELRFLKRWPVGELWETQFAERNLHKILKRCRVRGEWFKLSPAQIECFTAATQIFPYTRANPLREMSAEEYEDYLTAGSTGFFLEWTKGKWPR